MHRLTLTLTLLLIVVCGLRAADWQGVVHDTVPKVPRLEILQDGADSAFVCSGVIFAIDPDGTAAALTAAHCVTGKHLTITVNRHHAEVALVNRLLDLAVVTFEAKHEQAIAFAPVTPPMGAEVAILGYALGSHDLAAQFGRVSQAWNAETETLWVNADLLFGDSGGLAIDEQGRLVGINSRIYYGGLAGQMAHVAAIIAIEDVRDFVSAYQKGKGKKP